MHDDRPDQGDGPNTATPALAARLSDLAAQRQRENPALDAAYDRMIDRLDSSVASVPGIGDPMPDFLLPDDQGRLAGLADFLKDGPLVLSLNRGHWCSFCRMELRNFSEIAPEIAELGASVVSIIPEKRRFAAELKSQYGIGYPILCDIDNAYALSLGLMFWVGAEVRDHLMGSGVNLSQFQDNDGWFLPIPATFVVSPRGLVTARFVEPDFRRRMPPEQIFQALGRVPS